MLSTHGMASVEELCDHIGLIDHSKLMLNGNVREIRRRYSDQHLPRGIQRNAQGGFGQCAVLHRRVVGHDESRKEHGSCASEQVQTPERCVAPTAAGREVLGVHEEIPRMHDIFIRVVSEKQPETVTAGLTE
jgi:ABC-2 type transport system ATP-binding protein